MTDTIQIKADWDWEIKHTSLSSAESGRDIAATAMANREVGSVSSQLRRSGVHGLTRDHGSRQFDRSVSVWTSS